MADRIKSDYESHTKEELLAEAQARGIEGLNTGSLKGDIVAALQLDDESKENARISEKATPTAIPQVEAKPTNDISGSVMPVDDQFTHGLFVKTTGQDAGDKFALCKHDPDTYGRTHTLKNSVHTWQGTEDEFRANFDKA